MLLTPTLYVVVGLAASGSLGLALLVLARPPRRLAHWSFGAGMLGFAAESLAALGLLVVSEGPASHRLWASLLQLLGVLIPWAWAVFAFVLGRAPDAPVPRGWKMAFGGELIVLLAGVAVSVVSPPFQFPPEVGPFRAGFLTSTGHIGIVLQLLATVAVLYGLEPSLRRSHGETRWRVKFLALGLGGIFAVRFYLLSQVLLFRVLPADFLLAEAGILAVGNLLLVASLIRTQRLGVDLAVSRHFVYRSVAVAVTGGYLLVTGLMGWLLRELGVPETVFWGSLALFVSAVGVAVLLLSEDLRWRVQRYISTHFYRNKYDYREQWRTFTARLSSRVTLDSLIPELLRLVSEAIGAPKVLLYLRDDRDGQLHLAGSVGGSGRAPMLDVNPDDFLPTKGGRQAWLMETWASRQPLGIDSQMAVVRSLAAAGLAALVALPWHERLLGLLLIGAQRAGETHSPEDLELLTTVGEQAAAVVAGAQASERLAQARSFEAFHRLTSFVVHDLKNAVSALSMLGRNALDHFDNPAFQRDAIGTLSRTVERVKTLLGKLSSTPEVTQFHFEELDLAALLADVATSLITGKRVSLRRQNEPLPVVLGDRSALERVFQNLITNAMEAMDGEGELTLQTKFRGSQVVCSVSDTGCGMSPEFVRKSLFVPFQSTKKGGWGIGLYQVKEIVEAHRGRIEVETQEGKGTTFILLFPPAPGEIGVEPKA